MAILSLLKIVKLKAAIFRGFSHTLGGVITILSALVSLLILFALGGLVGYNFGPVDFAHLRDHNRV